MDGKYYTEDESIQVYVDAIKEFKRDYPLFIGAKLIYSKSKLISNEKMQTYFERAGQLYAKYPQLVVGFDLVGQEDKPNPLMSYAEQILNLPDGLKLYLHAGETNWFGSVDENLVIDDFFFCRSCAFIPKKNSFSSHISSCDVD